MFRNLVWLFGGILAAMPGTSANAGAPAGALVAEYRFERLDGFVLRRGRERPLTVAFDRERDFAPRIIESLVVDPDRLPRGRYRLHIEVSDQVQQVRSTSATIEFRLR